MNEAIESSGQNQAPRSHLEKTRPYPLHTNNELALMLSGRKPMAHFADAYDGEPWEEVFPEESFAPHVESGRFVVRDFVVPDKTLATKRFPNILGVRHLFYAQSYEAWRIEAFILLIFTWQKVAWNEGFERIEGSLLGYEEWQNDIHIQLAREQHNHG